MGSIFVLKTFFNCQCSIAQSQLKVILYCLRGKINKGLKCDIWILQQQQQKKKKQLPVK